MTGSYPLQWPITQDRTETYRRKWSKFKTTHEQAQRGVERELALLGARSAVISTNIKLRMDGLPYANQAQPEDPGVAVYFDYKGSRHCMAIDQYVRLWENIRAIEKSLEAIRGIERWGGAKIMETAISGFKELPAQSIVTPYTARLWHEVLQVSPEAGPEIIKAAYRQRLLKTHPDQGGNEHEFAEVQAAYKQAMGAAA